VQRQVTVLRDIGGRPAEEARELLGLSVGNQRVCLQRARSRVRQTLEDELAGCAL
jgi:DNA-directed RNA polymerase specialized sigma24 family protein